MREFTCCLVCGFASDLGTTALFLCSHFLHCRLDLQQDSLSVAAVPQFHLIHVYLYITESQQQSLQVAQQNRTIK